MPAPSPRGLRSPEAATYLGVATGELERRRRDGSGPPFVRLGRAVIYDRVDLDKWLEDKPRHTTVDPLPVTAADVALVRVVNLLSDRLAALEARLAAGDECWADLYQAGVALAQMRAGLPQDAGGRRVTTSELAAALAVSPRTVRRRKKAGTLGVAKAKGKGASLIGWRRAS